MNKASLPSFLQIPGRSEYNRLMPYGNTLLWAAIIGVIGGFIATLYYWVLNGGLYVIWDVLHPALDELLAIPWSSPIALVLLTASGGAIVGLSIKWLSAPGEISAVVNNIHIKNGRMDYGQNPSMLINSLVRL